MAKANELDELLRGKIIKEQSTPRERLATAPIESTPDSDAQYVWVDVELLDDSPFQPPGRLDPEEMQRLVEGMDAVGQVYAAIARPHPTKPGRFQLANGHRRRTAVAKYGVNAGIRMPNPRRYIGQLKIEVRELSDAEMLRIIIESNENLLKNSPLQSARVYSDLREITTRELLDRGEKPVGDNGLASWRQVVQMNGYGENQFVNMARLAAILDLPESMQREFEPDPKKPDKFVLNGRHARALLKFQPKADADDKERARLRKQQNALLRKIKNERLAGTDAEKEADAVKKSEQPALSLGADETGTETKPALSLVGKTSASTPTAASATTETTANAITIGRTSAPAATPEVSQETAFSEAPLDHWSAAAEYLNRALIELEAARAANIERNREVLEAMRETHENIELKFNHLDAEIDEFEKSLNE